MLSKKKSSVLFTLGGICYGLLEIVWRGETHWSMVLTGGACFLSLIRVFKRIAGLPLVIKSIVGGAVITTFEFISGCIFNKWLKLKVWDYSDRPLNFKGQICPFYSLMWVLLSAPVSVFLKKVG